MQSLGCTGCTMISWMDVCLFSGTIGTLDFIPYLPILFPSWSGIRTNLCAYDIFFIKVLKKKRRSSRTIDWPSGTNVSWSVQAKFWCQGRLQF